LMHLGPSRRSLDAARHSCKDTSGRHRNEIMSMTFEDALSVTGNVTLRTLATFEAAQRRLHPPAIAHLRDEIAPLARELDSALVAYRAVEPPPGLAPLHTRLGEAADLALAACRRFCEQASPEQSIIG